jgi:hypothetical protein
MKNKLEGFVVIIPFHRKKRKEKKTWKRWKETNVSISLLANSFASGVAGGAFSIHVGAP